MKKLFACIGLAFFLASCGLGNLDNSLQDQVTRLEAGYTAALKVLVEAREPCVDTITTNDDKCLIDDKLYAQLKSYTDKADRALTEASKFADKQDTVALNEQIEIFKEQFGSIEKIVELVKNKL